MKKFVTIHPEEVDNLSNLANKLSDLIYWGDKIME